MSRPLRKLGTAQPTLVLDALRRALDGRGPAMAPLGQTPDAAAGLPETVDPRVAVVVTTSGSTGAPKRVALSAAALRSSAEASLVALGGPGRWIVALPLHYIAGIQMLVRSMVAGLEPSFYTAEHFDAQTFAKQLDEQPAGRLYSSLVPVQLARLLDAAQHPDAAVAAPVRHGLQRLDAVLVGGQATPPDLLRRAADLGLRAVTSYGSSETAGGCVYDSIALPGVRVQALDGELAVAGPQLAEGYLGDPARTAARFVTLDAERWYLTGDLGELRDGRVQVLGRADNVIISGGIKVSLDAIERAVAGIPGCAGAVAVPVSDERWGQASVLVVVEPTRMPGEAFGLNDEAEPGTSRRERALLAAVRQRVGDELGAPARPLAVVACTKLPLLSTGKVDRRALAALAQTAADTRA